MVVYYRRGFAIFYVIKDNTKPKRNLVMSKQKGFCAHVGRPRLSSRGFTILEFIVALALLVVAVGLAVPGLREFTANNQFFSENNQHVSANNAIVTGLNLARSTAITTGDDITICPSADGATCADDSWDDGYIVFNDANGDGNVANAEIIRVIMIESDVNNSGFGENIVFQADGTTELGAKATITSCREQGTVGENCANVTINQFGMIESAKHSTRKDDGGS
jgi:type IV fimbrial biogenesis protein FimT